MAGILNGQSFDQVRALMQEAGGDLLRGVHEGDDLAELAETLSPGALLGLISGADEGTAELLLGELGPDGVMQTVQNLPDNAVLDFLWGTAGERLESMFDGVSLGAFDSWYDSLPPGMLSDIGDRLDGTSIPRPDEGPPLLSAPPPGPGVQPADDEDQEEDPDGQSANSMSGDCFIARVAFRNPQRPAVWMLRWYRDTVLRRYVWGRALVALYWRLGPGLARMLSNHPHALMAIRWALHLVALCIAAVARRRMGRQRGHRLWPENRACQLPLARKVARAPLTRR